MATKVFTRSVWYEPEQLETVQHKELCEQLQISAMPGTFYIPIIREYPSQEEFPRAKKDLLKRMLFAGYPHSNTSVRASGSQLRQTAGRGIYRRAASMQYTGDVRTPSGSTAAVISEIKDRGKTMCIPLLHLTSLENPDVPMFEPTMVVTDTWSQELNGIEFLFFTAYAHFNGAPRDWYTRCTFYSVITPHEGCDNRIHLFPEVITNARTVRLNLNAHPLDKALFVITNGTQMASISDILFADDPIWTVSEDVFELTCPIWWSKLQYKIPEVFEEIDGSKHPMVGRYRFIFNDHHTSVLATSWIMNRSGSGVFYGYTYDKDSGLLEYGLFVSIQSEKVHYAESMGVVDIKEVPGEPILDRSVVFRPGFKPNTSPTTDVKTPVPGTVEEAPTVEKSTATASDHDHRTSVLPQEESETVTDVSPSEEEPLSETSFQEDQIQEGDILKHIAKCIKEHKESAQKFVNMQQWAVSIENKEEDGAAIVSGS